jgi:peptidyl-prolyl cis-trans isomerase C
MQKQLKFLTTAILAAGLALPVLAQGQLPEDTSGEPPSAATVVATVNGVEITLGHMIAARATLPQQYQELPDQVLFDGILEQLIQQSALAQSFDGELPPRVVLSLENETRSLKAGEAIEAIMAKAVSEEDVKVAYDAAYGSIDPQEEFNASHILVETEEEAKAVKELLDGGADFAETAREKSTGPSGPNGGELGWFGQGAMVPTFEAAVVALSTGEISAPVQTQFGWHVIKLNEKRQADIPGLEDVRADLENELRREAAEKAIEETADKADIKLRSGTALDPSLLKNLQLLE